MTKATEVFHIFTSSYPNLLIKWRSTSSFPIVFFNYEKTREFLRRSENSFRPFYSVNHSIWKSPKMSHFWCKNSNEIFVVIFKDCSTLGKTRNMTERDVFVWLGIVYFTYYFWPKSICALCYNRRRIMSKCGNVPYINK